MSHNFGKKVIRRAIDSALFEVLEGRQLLAAHIVGDSTVYPSIQAAVNAASPGSIINIDAGAYSERVSVNKSLTIRGAQAGVDPRGNARLYRPSAAETILNGYDTGTGRSPSFLINANDVTIDGFIIQGNTQGGDSQAAVIIGPNQHGTHILDNIVQNNVSGIFMSNDSGADAAVVQFNVFRNNNNAGGNGGHAIYSDAGISPILTNVIVDNNVFNNNRGGSGTTTYEAAIAYYSRTEGTQSNFTITNNTFDGNGKGICVWNVRGMVIKYNTITNTLDHWSGTWRFEGDVQNVDFEYNNTYSNTGTGIRVDNKGYNSGINSAQFCVQNNNFYGNSNFYSNKESVVVGLSQYDRTFDARNNWWGAATGPSGVQSSTGDAITTNGNNVLYSPWASSPVVSTDSPYFGVPFSTGAVIQAEDFDHGGEGNAYHDSDKANSGTMYRTSGVDVESTTDTGGGYDVGFFVAGEWMNYNIKVDQAGAYNIDFRVSSQNTGGTFHLEVDGVNVTGAMSVPNTTNWQIWQTLTKTGVSLSAGSHVLRLVGDTNGASKRVGNFNWLRLNPAVSMPAAPSNLLAVAASTTSINLTWKDNATNETGQKIERSTDGLNFTPLITLGAGVTSYTDSGLSNSQAYWYRVRATNAVGDSAASNVSQARPLPTDAPPTYISDLAWGSATTGWGSVQRDATIKGSPITLRGVKYAKGIGTHAVSSIVYNLAGNYTTFTSDIGVDDEVGGQGFVDFQVIGDGNVRYDSGVLNGNSPVIHISVDLTGVQTLTLVTNNGVDGVDFDHADWAGAQLLRTAPAPAAPSVPVNLTATVLSTTSISLQWINTNNTQTGIIIERSTDGVNFTPLATVGATTTTYTDNTALANMAYTYRVRATNTAGDSANSNFATATTPQVAPTATYLSDLQWASATSGYLTVQKDTSIKGNPITVNGVTYAKGIGTHAVSQIVYNVNGAYDSFVSDVGIDSEEDGVGQGSVIFQVIGDGNVLFDSGVVTNDSPTLHINVSVVGVQQLTLVATNGVADNVYFDHADWAGAKLIAPQA